jgi:hypothetical protein
MPFSFSSPLYKYLRRAVKSNNSNIEKVSITKKIFYFQHLGKKCFKEENLTIGYHFLHFLFVLTFVC